MWIPAPAEESASRVAGTFDHSASHFRVTNGSRGSSLQVGDLKGFHSDSSVPKIVLNVCKQLDREAKLHLASLKSVVTGIQIISVRAQRSHAPGDKAFLPATTIR